ncbi:aminopeptidase N-like isoform X3 [Artemia franciscana]|uniref:Aminopeptidase n=2 Tax=Artemia franciscana TaxID=6661 RepID=A0AA88HGW5_ARTSF|nr:hypothetical protein QYM36_017169 [Artemia franciscana]KAK2705034.1 hypothetical protein QYM36_017169 [Artemia franciscana]KAK2705036.1 hypothetical protein QYM36_017169 [Artemia franciscana]KAK2705037.1 hypothetical protein QYM36_017169 [Artemia franciscana]
MGKGVTLPKWLVIAACIIFVGGMVAVGLCVYYLAPPPPGSEVTTDTTSTVTETTTQTDMTTTTLRPPGDINYRLPRHFSPILYTVRLLPIIEEGNFTIFGDVTIDMVCNENTNHIVLHINDMDVHQETIKVSGEGLEGMMVHHTSFDQITQFFTIHLSGELKAGMQLSLSMSYLAKLNDILGGFYRSSYFDVNGNRRYIATTQFQPTDARRAFPCFDEPNFKARFAITLGRKKDMTSISNMPINRTVPHENMPDYEWDIYEESVPMSTYLVAFVISDFVKNPAPNAGETEVAVWSRPGAEEQTRYATNITSTVLEYFEEFFQIPYPLPKQDMIAIPDFGAGAMENWGLITYRETAVLYQPGVSSAQNKQRVAVVIAHELAHQWFGNLVTTDWWDLLWLNEGFATYLEFKGVDRVEPEMKMEQQYLNDAIHYVMQLDGLNSSHPMIMPANNPDEINELFDPIAYEKSGSVLRMMEDFLGLEVLKEGLTNYLNNRTYDTATADVLWEFLGDTATKYSVDLNGLTVKDILDTWSLQKNFPVVKVERNPENYTEITVSQKRFISAQFEGAEEYYWHVPLTFIQDFSNNSSLKRRWLSNSSEPAVYTDIIDEPNSWIICNHKVFGYYRVDYDEINWDLIQVQLQTNHTKIDVMNRAQIVDDALNLASADYLNQTYKRAMDLTSYLKNEFDWLPWETADNNFDRLRNLLSGTEAGALLNDHIRSLALHLYELYDFNEDPMDKHLDLFLRTIAVRIACGTNFAPCVEKAKENFINWSADPDNAELISPNLKPTITCTAMREGDVKEFDFLVRRYNSTNVAAEKDQLLSAMMCTDDIILLRRLLEWSITDGSPIRKQDAVFVYRGMATNQIGKTLALGFIQDNWEQIASYTGGYLTATEWIQSVSRYYNKQSELDELIRLKEEKAPQLGTVRTLDQAIEQVTANVQWLEKHYQTIHNWLRNNSGNPVKN